MIESGHELLARYERGERVFQGIDLRDADLRGTDLTGIDLSRATIKSTNFSDATLVGARFTNAKISANFSGSNLEGSDFTGATVSKSSLAGASLVGARMSSSHLSTAVLNNAVLQGADLSGAILHGTYLKNSNLTQANLSGASLGGADLSNADLSNARLWTSTFSGTRLIGSNLTGAYLVGARLISAHLAATIVTGAICDRTLFADLDLRGMSGLDTIEHLGPSTIGMDTLYRSQGAIPAAFLRGCGLPDAFITFSHGLSVTKIEHYSCFISHSSRDLDFAHRLHASLQKNSVRCWFAPQDLKTGDKTRNEIENAIKRHQKFVVVLSKDSINSAWVEKEVETAFEEEARRGKPMIFPIRLDDEVMTHDLAWVNTIRRERVIGSFVSWREPLCYTEAFDRLLHDLKMESDE